MLIFRVPFFKWSLVYREYIDSGILVKNLIMEMLITYKRNILLKFSVGTQQIAMFERNYMFQTIIFDIYTVLIFKGRRFSLITALLLCDFDPGKPAFATNQPSINPKDTPVVEGKWGNRILYQMVIYPPEN